MDDTVPRIHFVPSQGLDVMSVFRISFSFKNTLRNQNEGNIWKEYQENLEKLIIEFSQLTLTTGKPISTTTG